MNNLEGVNFCKFILYLYEGFLAERRHSHLRAKLMRKPWFKEALSATINYALNVETGDLDEDLETIVIEYRVEITKFHKNWRNEL
jgi:hypothetical protein